MKTIKEMEQLYKLYRNKEEEWADKANMIEDCLLCQKSKRYAKCPADCICIEAQR